MLQFTRSGTIITSTKVKQNVRQCVCAFDSFIYCFTLAFDFLFVFIYVESLFVTLLCIWKLNFHLICLCNMFSAKQPISQFLRYHFFRLMILSINTSANHLCYTPFGSVSFFLNLNGNFKFIEQFSMKLSFVFFLVFFFCLFTPPPNTCVYV